MPSSGSPGSSACCCRALRITWPHSQCRMPCAARSAVIRANCSRSSSKPRLPRCSISAAIPAIWARYPHSPQFCTPGRASCSTTRTFIFWPQPATAASRNPNAATCATANLSALPDAHDRRRGNRTRTTRIRARVRAWTTCIMMTPATITITFRRQTTRVAQPRLCACGGKTGLHASWQVPSDHDTHHAWSENPCRGIREKLQAARNQLPHGLLNT